MQSLTIQIPQPCPEHWSAMQPTERGRFCASCQKTVTDYTALSDRELVKHLSQASETTCGRFLNQQLNRALPLTQPAPASNWRQWLGVLSLSVLGWQTVRAQPSQSQKTSPATTVRPDATQPGYPGSVLPVQKAADADKKRVIRGRVLLRNLSDSLAPLPQVNVAVRRLGETWQTQTDSTGAFTLPVPLQIPVTELSVWTFVPGLGRLHEQITVEAAPSATEIVVQDSILNEPIELKEAIAGGITVIRPPSRWQRMKRKLFH